MPSSIAVLSDIHGMLPALDRVLREPAIDRAELIVVTGDHTWGPQPTEVLDRLTGLGDRVVLIRGNADRELLRMSQGVDVGLADDPLSVWGAAQLTPAHQQLLELMPARLTLDVDGFGPVLLCHATPRDDEEIVLVDSRMDRWEEVLREVEPDVRTVVCGHTHMPFVRVVDGRLVVNTGSVGLPYGRDGAHWAVLEAGAVTIGRTRVDADELVDETAAASAYPGARAWVEEAVRQPATDREALATFASRDGR
jgi:putative phosphoesterase